MAKRMGTNFKQCQECGDPVDVFESHCLKCLQKFTLKAYRAMTLPKIPERFRGGIKTFPIKKYPAFLQITHRAMEWADRFNEETETGLFFAGLPGIGKTGLAYAILRRVGERGFNIGGTTVADLFSRYRATWGRPGESERDIQNEFLDLDLVLLDDLGAESQNGINAESLYLLINTANERLKPVFIVTSNLGPEEKKEYYSSPNGQRVLPRLEQMCDADALGPFPAINLREKGA